MAPVMLRKILIAPAVSNRNGKILLTLGTRNVKILNTLLYNVSISTGWVQKVAVFDEVPHCIYSDIVGGSEKIQKSDNAKILILTIFWKIDGETIQGRILIKVNSVEEACAKYFLVHILKFEILQIT